MTADWFLDSIDPTLTSISTAGSGSNEDSPGRSTSTAGSTSTSTSAGRCTFRGADRLASAFGVTELAGASIGSAALETQRLRELLGAPAAPVEVDLRLASLWFAMTIVPDGWSLPPVWDDLAGDYPTADGWIRLHTNASHHRAAMLRALGCAPERDAVGTVLRSMAAADAESAVVEAGGCAAAMRSLGDWDRHPQGAAVAAEALIDLAWHPSATPVGASGARGTPERPLAGVRVLDLTRVLAGPVATRFLAGLGAEVLRIDPVDWNEPAVIPDVIRGKRAARLDLRSAEGRDRLEALIGAADLFVHGYRPEALERLGFAAPIRRALNPGLVDVCLDAYGWTGPWAARRGFDSLVQMSTGVAHEGRAAGVEPPRPLPVQALDHATGYLLAAAALRGWRHRLRDGRGSTGRVSLARTARPLVDGPRGDPEHRFRPLDSDDLDPELEATPWGPARRVRPPVRFDGMSLRWPSPTQDLGTAEPCFTPAN
ncbi:MAG: CoA transferase [Ilumatobacteraceae bacterium]